MSVIRLFSVVGANAREAVDSMRKARLRTALGIIGIMVGISSVIAMVSVGEIAQEQARKQFEELGTDIVVIRKSFESAASVEIDLEDAIALDATVASIIEAAPRILGDGEFIHSGKTVGNGSVNGVTATFASVNQLIVQKGRFISDFDIGRYFCVIGADLASEIRNNGVVNPVGTTVEVGGRLFTIVGVLQGIEENYVLPVQIDANRSIFIPISTAQRVAWRPEIEVIIARSRTDIHHEKVAADITEYFRRRAPGLQLQIITAKELIARMESQMNIFSLLLGAVGSISLIVGGIGIMNIMLVSVAERRQEIAIRRALGAQRRDIQSQFLTESIILTMVGGIFGIALGLAVTWGICRYTNWDFMVSVTSIASGLGTAAIAGLFFGFQPAYQASRLDPIAGLQSE
ncbi:MAG: ABC transporter permease [Aestuariivita sp.]|nr:ABC transporter permease [Aestuariivita sp.]MCY4345672.1 ABC transporter permease [Aestuariivita sp.]